METWKPLRNFPGYNGSTEGRIINVRTQKIQKPVVNKNGHAKVSLYKNKKHYYVKVHKLIGETFLGECPGMDINHKDGDLLNNRVDNLEWRTRSNTISDAYKRGTKTPRRSKRDFCDSY